MTDQWTPADTTTHQDHVIAHVIGATVSGYLTLNEALHILLDIGFIWTIYVDGEMGLLPHPVAIGELEVDEETRDQIKTDIDLLLRDGISAEALSRLTPCPVDCLIKEVRFFMNNDGRRLLVFGEDASLTIETSLSGGGIRIAEGAKEHGRP